MSFTTIKFLWFLAGFLIVYSACPAAWRRWVVLAGGLAFACLGSFWGGVAVLGFTAANFSLGGLISTVKKPKPILIAGIAANLLALLFFKLSGRPVLGMSFYTLLCIRYLADVAQGATVAEESLLRFAGCTLFFPKYPMGPLVGCEELIEQLDAPKLRSVDVHDGLQSFTMGFAMKVLLADRLAELWAGLERAGYSRVSFALAWVGLFAFALRVYLEWQSYCLMASGLARLFGVRLPVNFDAPIVSRTIREFFRRFARTLGEWFHDYVFVPLGGSKQGTGRTALNIVLVWVLVGLWHGTHWNFVLWGLLIAALLLIERLWLGKRLQKSRILSHLWVLLPLTLSMVVFAFTDFSAMGAFFVRLIPFVGSDEVRIGLKTVIVPYVAPLLVGLLCCFPIVQNLVHRFKRSWVVSGLLAGLFWWSVIVLVMNGGTSFLYLNL